MAIHPGKISYLEIGGYDLSSFVSEVQADPVQVSMKLDGLPDATMTINGYWDALPGLTECTMTFVVPPWMLEPRYRKALALFLDPVGYRRRRRMHAAYRRRQGRR